MAHRRQKRRGVLLLVSLVLLVLFLMLGVTFVLMAGNFRRSSEAYRRLQESGDATANAENLLHGVARDLVRGTSNPESPFSKENLLEDMYGQPALRGSISAVAPDMGGQFTKLTITADADFPNFATQPEDYYSGLVLTMVTGTAAHQSTRVVDSSSNTLTVMTGGKINATDLQSGDLVLVNGRPFSGDGRGHTADDPKRLNEDYDAPDLNNPWLTGLAAYVSTGSASGEDTHLQAAWGRSEFKWGSGESNPNYNRPRNSVAEVDNDGDGEPESIWIDAGLPLQERADGRLVKPLVAMLVRDLDGRVNVNAHGSRTATALEADHTFNNGDDLNGDGNIDASDQPILPLGQGYGPAEIDPQYVLATATATDILDARHAPDSVPGAAGEDALSAVSQFHHYGGVGDPAIPRNSFITPHDIVGSGLVARNANGQLCYDKMGGQTAFTDDPYEMQLDTAFDAPNSDTPFTPAELEAVFRAGDADAAELPRRLHDLLQQGVATNDPAMQSNQLRTARAAITTESWDLPVHPHALPEELSSHVAGLPDPLKALLEAPAHITDLFKTRIHQMDPEYPPGSSQNLSTEQDPDDLQTALNVLISALGSDAISPEMLRGLKFNVNRLFGNGQDDNNNDVVDEPGETKSDGTGEKAYGGSVSGAPVPGHFSDVDFDHNGNGTSGASGGVYTDPDDKQARQQYAKQLYLLLMLVSDMRESGTNGLQNDGAGSPNAVVPAPTGTTLPDGQDRRRLLARRLAQFAVNAVDYRDADSIMTGFEYDASPFDGWDADGDLDDSTPAGNNDIGVVWGAEAPAAVLTGTLALHDMRVKDTDVGGTDVGGTVAGGKTTVAIRVLPEELSQLPDPLPNPGEPLGIGVQDEDFDQYAPPQGSLFLQIHALPNAYPTRDLYQSTGQLKLSKTHDDTASGDPVWRVAISEPHALGQSTKDTAGQGSPNFPTGKGSPVFNQLRDVDSSGVVDPEEETASQWNPLVTMQPDSFDALQDNLDENEVQNQVVIERVVYFANTTGSATPVNAQYYNQDSTDVLLTPGASKVVGPRSQTSVRAAGETTATVTSDVICTLGALPSGWTGDGTNPGMSVSEPLENNYYNDQGSELVDDPMMSGDQIYSPAFDSPFDQTKLVNITEFLQENDVATITDEQTPPGTVDVDRPSIGGTVENYCTAFLQRLANPLLPWNPLPDNPDYDPALEVNPYITVDAMPIDLTVYNGDGGGVVWDVSAMTVKATPDPEYPDNFDSRGWRERAKLAEPMGTLTSSLTEPSASAITTTSDPAPFWPNRPFVSQYELLMVPASEPGKLSFELSTHSGDPQANFGDGFPHLLNFFYEDSSSNEPRLGRLFDYLHVPSRYAGTQTTLRPDTFQTNTAGFSPPFNQVSQYREPGRVNLNTIYEPSVWEAILHGVPNNSDPTVHPGPPWNSDPTSGLAGLPEARGGTDTTPTTVTSPFRAATAGTLNTSAMAPVPPLGLRRDTTSDNLLFADVNQTASPYFRYQPINRLGNLVTTRSNVYAVWMTLGFFEIRTDSSGNVTGATEVGSDTGEQERYRAFYMIDRSIPVGYENGQDHNTEDVFRVQRFIE
jgi:hypothetical protein